MLWDAFTTDIELCCVGWIWCNEWLPCERVKAWQLQSTASLCIGASCLINRLPLLAKVGSISHLNFYVPSNDSWRSWLIQGWQFYLHDFTVDGIITFTIIIKARLLLLIQQKSIKTNACWDSWDIPKEWSTRHFAFMPESTPMPQVLPVWTLFLFLMKKTMNPLF